MKADFLKIAGVQTEEEFYKKYPTQESFLAKCGSKLTKAQWGQIASVIGGATENMTGDETFNIGGKEISIMETMNVAGNLAKGIGAIKAEKDQVKQAQQTQFVSDAALMAKRSDNSAQELAMNRQQYQVNPWDNVITGEERMPVYGVGTNVLAKYGKTMPKAQFGSFMSGPGGDMLSGITSGLTKNSGGSQVGGAIGDAVKMIPGVGPIAGAVAKPVLQALGHFAFSQGSQRAINKAQSITDFNMNNMAGMDFGQNWQAQNSAFAKNGTTINNDLNVLKGGNVQPMSFNPYAPDGGETSILKGNSHKNGGIIMEYGGNMIEAENDEPVVKLDENTASIMGRLDLPKNFKQTAEALTNEKFKGNKFNTFIKSVGEAEEKQNKLIDKSVKDAENYTNRNPLDRISMNTLNLNIEQIAKPKLQALQDVKEGAAALQDSINQTAEEMNLNPEMLSKGKLQKAKYGKKIKYAALGEEVTDDPIKKFKTAEEAKAAGYELHEGRWRKTLNPGTPEQTITYYEAGEIIDDADDPVQIDNSYTVRGGKSDVTYQDILNNQKKYKTFHSRMQGAPQNVREAAAKALYEKGIMPSQYTAPVQSSVEPVYTPSTFKVDAVPATYQYAELEEVLDPKDPKKKQFPWADLANAIPNMWQQSDAEDFDYRQLIPEMNALATNQLEPVEAQKFRPRLDVPYDISYQDLLNENRASTRAAERMAKYNPGMLANLKAQEYMANQKVLGEQFRANQAKKDAVYSGNRQILNEADLKNLQIMDTQYTRQAQAKSNTKATTQAALSSISDKLAKHRLENKTLKTWENMYDYRYDPNYVARYQGPAADFENMWSSMMSGKLPEDKQYVTNEKGERIGIKTLTKKEMEERKRQQAGGTPGFNPSGKNGYLVKSYKKFK